MSNSFLLGELVSEQLVEGVIWAASVISPQLISTWHYSGILSVQSDLAYLQKKKEEEKVRHCGQFYLVSCSILLGWRILICCHLFIVWFLHQQALKELKTKAQKGAIGGSGLKKSGKKWAWPPSLCCASLYAIVTVLPIVFCVLQCCSWLLDQKMFQPLICKLWYWWFPDNNDDIFCNGCHRTSFLHLNLSVSL